MQASLASNSKIIKNEKTYERPTEQIWMLSWQEEQAEHGWIAREQLQIRLQQLQAVADQSLTCLQNLASLASISQSRIESGLRAV